MINRNREDLDFEIDFFEGILARDPNYSEPLMALGNAYIRKGDYGKGLEVDRRLAALRPSDPVVFYNLACSLSLLKRVDEAFDALERAIGLGYSGYDYMLQDEDLVNVRRDPRFSQIILTHFQDTKGA